MFHTELDALEEVSSSQICFVGTKDDWLLIMFRNGSWYRYKDMAHHYADLIMADSVGKYFIDNIKHVAVYERIDEMDPWPDD